MADEKYILEVKNLCQYFTSGRGRNKLTVKAVDDVSFGVKPAETFGLVGESGCGKTTTGRTIIRLYNPTSGEVFFEGRNVAGPMTRELRKYLTDNIAMIFQDPIESLNPRMTIEEIVGEGLRVRGMKDKAEVRRRVRAPYRTDGQPKDWEETPDGRFRNTCPSNFWDDISVPYWSMPENTAHPTQKPEKLLAKLILASSDPGGIVLDPFAGSGSTAVTAKKLGRRFVAIERSEQYCAWAEKRLELAETTPAIQGYADGVFWERNAGRLPR